MIATRHLLREDRVMQRLASFRRTRMDRTLDVLVVPPFDARGALLTTEERLDLWSSDPHPRWFESAREDRPEVPAASPPRVRA
jgi:hypothetical protein